MSPPKFLRLFSYKEFPCGCAVSRVDEIKALRSDHEAGAGSCPVVCPRCGQDVWIPTKWVRPA